MDSKTISLLRLENKEWHSDSRIAMTSLPVPMRGTLPPGLRGVATQCQTSPGGRTRRAVAHGRRVGV
jgi:hypothetical protein